MSTGSLAYSGEIDLIINDHSIDMDVSPRIINGRTMVPLRSIFESLGAEVKWINSTSTAIAILGSNKVKLQLNNPKASINSKEIILDVPAQIVEGRTLVPIRFIAESLGAQVSWDNKNRIVNINTKTEEKIGTSEESLILDLVNIERSKVGLNPLKLDSLLSSTAQLKSKDMADKNYFSHTSPTYGSPFDMMKSFGVKYSYAGENIAQGHSSAKNVMDAWMKSPGHRENILSPNFAKLGLGYIVKNGTTYWTQMFTN